MTDAAAGGLIEVLPNHRFDTAALEAYLAAHLDGFAGPVDVRQFAGGQSNPTFLLTPAGAIAGANASYVLRKKPPGDLLPSAHQVEREYRVCRGLAGTDVPVPRPRLLCEDASVIGTPFFVMEYVEGRVFRDPALTALAPEERRAIYSDMNRVLAALHTVDFEARGLGDYGRPGNYFARQISRWTKQFLAARTHAVPAMDRLIEWLPEHTPENGATSIVHGDYQLYNLMVHPTEPRIVAVLDWELSTLGHPLADLAYNCMKYHSPSPEFGLQPGAAVPAEEDFVAEYCERTGRNGIANWNFYLAFSFFRLASIIQGVYKRGLQGNASSARALDLKGEIARNADVGWRLARA